MYCYTFVTLHMQNKYIRLQIYCDFSVRIQILQLQVLKTFATIIPSYSKALRSILHVLTVAKHQLH